MNIITETKRLILREIDHQDLDGMYELDSDPKVHRFLGNRPIMNRDKAAEIIDHVRDQYKNFGIGRLAIIEKGSGAFIGWAGLKFVTEEINHHKNYYDLGYRLIRRFWGKGYAIESASACLASGFDRTDIDTIFAAAHIENSASNRILVKLGFQFKELFEYDGSNHNWYALDRAEWQSRPWDFTN